MQSPREIIPGIGLCRKGNLFLPFEQLFARAVQIGQEDSPGHTVHNQVMRREKQIVFLRCDKMGRTDQSLIHVDARLDDRADPADLRGRPDDVLFYLNPG